MRNIKIFGVVNFEAAVINWMKENDIDEVKFISSDSKKYFGKYGTLVEYWYDGSIHWYEKPRKIARLISKYFEATDIIIDTYMREDDDGYDVTYNTLYFFDKPYRVLQKAIYDDAGYPTSNTLIMLANGQPYDITDHYWFSMRDGKDLKQAIKNNYSYENVDTWQYDNYDSEYDKIKRLEKEATTKLIRSSVDKLLTNPEFKVKAQAVANWIYNHEKILEDDKVSTSAEAFRNYVYGYTPGYILYSIYSNLHYDWIKSDTKPAYAKHLVKNKVEYDYAGRILNDPKECLNVLRKNFPKLDTIIEERLSDPFCSVTLEDLEKEAMAVSNFDWTSAMSDIYNKLGFSCTRESWYKVLM